MLRGVAAWWVVLFHAISLLPTGAAMVTTWQGGRNPLPLVASGGWIAVTMFLVVSGFTLATGLRDHSVQWRWFLASRWLRIAPLYLVLLLIGLAVAAPTYPPLEPGDGGVPARIAAALTLLPLPEAWTPVPWLATSWSVRIEFALYLSVPVIVLVLARWRPRLAIPALVGASLLLLVTAITVSGAVREVVYFGIPGRLPEFLAGFLLGYYLPRGTRWSGRRAVPWAAGAALVGLGVTATQLGGEPALAPAARLAIWAVTLVACAALVLWGAAPGTASGVADVDAQPRFKHQLVDGLRVLGVWSYSTYMWHYAVIVLVAAPVSVRLGEQWGITATLRITVGMVIAITVTALVSWLSFRLIESPFLRLRHRYVGSTGRGGSGGGHAG
jgi:peptidoglycan/LPS O-acetylase OafA/YrhL